MEQLDAWRAAGVPLVTTIHNGPMLRDRRAEAERRVAQAIVDRASLVHLLTASTPALLDGWLDLAAARCIHIPHPNYDRRSASPETVRRPGAGWTSPRTTRARSWWA